MFAFFYWLAVNFIDEERLTKFLNAMILSGIKTTAFFVAVHNNQAASRVSECFKFQRNEV